jgi:hypothetical protein
MFRMLGLIVSTILVSTVSSVAQITITQREFAGIGTTFRTHLYGQPTPLNTGSAGENQTWSLVDIPFSNVDSSGFINPHNSPFGLQFPTATHCKRIRGNLTDSFHYYELTPDHFNEVGFGDYYNNPAVYSPLTPAVQLYPLPLQYGSPAWTSVTEWLLNYGDGFIMTGRDSTIREVDAWGTLNTDFGSYNVLRMFVHYFSHTTYTGEPPSDAEYYAYEWVDINGNIVARLISFGPDPDFSVGTIKVTEITNLVGTPERSTISTSFSLLQNYPNPFNSTTQIRFDLPTTAQVQLRIFDIMGREVSTLIGNEQMSVGSHMVSWNGTSNSGVNVASGMYICRIEAGSYQNDMKMILLK